MPLTLWPRYEPQGCSLGSRSKSPSSSCRPSTDLKAISAWRVRQGQRVACEPLPGRHYHHPHFPGEEVKADLDSGTWVAPHWLYIQVASLLLSPPPPPTLLPAPWPRRTALHSQAFLVHALSCCLLLLWDPGNSHRFPPGHRVKGMQVGAGPSSPPHASLPAWVKLPAPHISLPLYCLLI